MTLQELKDAALELYNENKKWPVARLILELIEKNSTEKNAAVIDKYILEQIVDLFVSSYSGDDLIEWLNNHWFNPLDQIEWADIAEKDEYEPEEWQELLDGEDYLFISEDKETIILSW